MYYLFVCYLDSIGDQIAKKKNSKFWIFPGVYINVIFRIETGNTLHPDVTISIMESIVSHFT